MRTLITGLRKHGVLWALLSWTCTLSVLAFMNWGKIRPYLPLPEEVPETSFGHIRRQTDKDANVYRTMLAVLSPSSYTHTFKIRGTKDQRLEVGLVRVGTKNNPRHEYVFTVHELTRKGKRKLFETSGRFPTDSWKLFETDEKVNGRDDGFLEIQYTVKPKLMRNRIASILASALGKPYYKDFAFIRPNALHERKGGELNVIVISFDTLRADHLGCYGYERDTSPHIDDFAEKNIRFSQAVSPVPHTAPAHRALFTGLHPLSQDRLDTMRGPINPFSKFVGTFQPFENFDTLASVLNDNGYYTIAFTGRGTMSSRMGFAKGFIEYREYSSSKRSKGSRLVWDSQEDDTKKTFDDAIEWLEKNSNAKFFMFLHTFECHTPYRDTHYVSDAPGESLIERRIALYDGDIRRADSHFGKFMQALHSSGLASDSIIVFVSDHGDDFHDHYGEADRIPPIPEKDIVPEFSRMDHGHSLYEELIHVPLIFSVPRIDPPRRVIDSQVQLMDVMPTILALLELEYSKPIQGHSLVGLLKGGSTNWDSSALGICTKGPIRRSIRRDGYKYIWTEKPYGRGGLPPIALRNVNQFELFDLKRDPEERNNIYEKNRALAEEYHRVLQVESDACRRLSTILEEGDSQMEADQDLPEDVVEALRGLGYLE